MPYFVQNQCVSTGTRIVNVSIRAVYVHHTFDLKIYCVVSGACS